MRAIHDLERQSDNPEEQQFCKLYNHLTDILSDKTGQEENKQPTKKPSFDSLPLPSQLGRQKTKRNIIAPPKMVSSDQFREYFESIEKKGKNKKRKRKRRRKKKKKSEGIRRKRRKEKKKQEKQKQQAENKIKKQMKSLKKRVQETEADSDNASMNSSQLVDDNSDVELSDENVMFVMAAWVRWIMYMWIGSSVVHVASGTMFSVQMMKGWLK